MRSIDWPRTKQKVYNKANQGATGDYNEQGMSE